MEENEICRLLTEKEKKDIKIFERACEIFQSGFSDLQERTKIFQYYSKLDIVKKDIKEKMEDGSNCVVLIKQEKLKKENNEIKLENNEKNIENNETDNNNELESSLYM